MNEDEVRPEVEVPADDDTQPVKDLLAEHVPLALLVDLVTPESTSAEILEEEGLPDEAWWESERGSTAADTAPHTEP